MLSLVTPPALEPVSLTEAKLHCRVHVSADDALLATLIIASREYGETATERAFCRQTWDSKRDRFPCWSQAIVLPKPACQAVSSITYLDPDGVSRVWDAANYLTDLPSGPQAQAARITPAYGLSYPATACVMNAVTVRFVAGYAGTARTVTSITRSSTTATVTTVTAHGYSTGQRITIAGADQADYNGTFEIVVTGAATFTFAVANSPTTPATGVVTATDLGIPSLLHAAMLLVIAEMYDNRSAVVKPGDVSSADALFWRYRVFS